MSAITEALTFPDYADNPNGGDVLVDNLNVHYDKGDMAWVLCATLFCWQITPVLNLCPSDLTRLGYRVSIFWYDATKSCWYDATTISILRIGGWNSVLGLRFLNDHVPIGFRHHRKSRLGIPTKHSRIRITIQCRNPRYSSRCISFHFRHCNGNDLGGCNA